MVRWLTIMIVMELTHSWLAVRRDSAMSTMTRRWKFATTTMCCRCGRISRIATSGRSASLSMALSFQRDITSARVRQLAICQTIICSTHWSSLSLTVRRRLIVLTSFHMRQSSSRQGSTSMTRSRAGATWKSSVCWCWAWSRPLYCQSVATCGTRTIRRTKRSDFTETNLVELNTEILTIMFSIGGCYEGNHGSWVRISEEKISTTKKSV